MQTASAGQSSSPNYRIEERGGNLRITIPPYPAIVGCLVGGIYLGAWVIGGLFLAGLIRELMNALFPPAEFARSTGWLAWLILFTGFTVSLIFNLWNLMRQEVVEIDPCTISVARRFLGLGRRAQYPVERIQTLRVIRAPWWSLMMGRGFWRKDWFSEWFQWGGWNTFWRRRYALGMDSGKHTVRFGDGLSEGEAKYILELIRKKYAP